MSEHYDFHYQPTGSGAISGQQVLQQTEDAINELGDYVNNNVGGAMDVAQQALETAQTANTNAQTALDTANSFSGAIQSAQQDASTALSTAQTAQTTASNANNTAIQAQQDASSAVTTANNASGQVSTLSGTVTALGQRVTTAEGNIGQNTSDITALTTRVGTAEGNITTLQNDVSIAQGNASSAMATAGTVKQQSYVLRYSSSSVTDNSTIAYSTLDNTDNVKSGDKVIDVDGKIFSVVSVDTANSTVTVGSALIDLALDSNVVHTSGDETVGGIKTFSNDTYIKTLNFTNEVASTSSSSGAIMPIIATVTYTDQTASNSARINLRIMANGDKSLYPHENNQYALGLTNRKWSEVHGVTYYYGATDIEFSTKFVTTDTNQAISGIKRFDNIIHLYGSYLGDEGSNNARTCSYSFSNRDTIGFSGVYQRRVRQNREQGQMSGNDISQYAFDILENKVRTNNVLYFVGRDFTNDIPKTMYIASQCNTRKLGSSLYPWSDTITNQINGVEPSALGMPDLSNGIDISSYLTAGNSNNTYTPSVNGWISISLGISSGGIAIFIEQGDMKASSYSNTAKYQDTDMSCFACLPVVAGVVVNIGLKGSSNYINSAKFYPCKGNV